MSVYKNGGLSILDIPLEKSLCALLNWSIFSWNALGTLIPLEGTLISRQYLSIVTDQERPYKAMEFSANEQDNAMWPRLSMKGSKIIQLPPNSPDRKPGEKLWKCLD
ncbi:hypothetical protein TNCV_1184741 [Trichonephila clavipes]|nr:hypothetical protein TNCV_1184741 [Trichonephila clavipes]